MYVAIIIEKYKIALSFPRHNNVVMVIWVEKNRQFLMALFRKF